jgi:2-amino-4-hydroxy-6-hydroxymethyldihydropteridine diphosphokinase
VTRPAAPARYWLGLGTNLGDREGALRDAVAWLTAADVQVEAVSAVYETAPRDLLDQPNFLNAACRVRTVLQPPEMLAAAKRLEADLGREPGPRFGPRAIDCDLLVWSGGAWGDPDLEIPHPRLWERLFALRPLLDLDARLALPDGRTVASLASTIDPAEQPIRRIGEISLLG